MDTIFARRRRRFLARMQEGVAVFRSAPVCRRNGDVDHPYRQDSDFHYLTGFEEPGAYAVFEKSRDRRRFVLFVEPEDPEQDVWTGRKVGVDGAVRDYGADEAFPNREFLDRLPDLLLNRPRLYLAFGRDPDFEREVLGRVETLKSEARKGHHGPWEVVDPRVILWDMRLRKTPAEVASLERACEVTMAGFEAAMRAIRPGMREWEVAAVLEFEFRRRGASRVSFETICAAGANAATLHYVANRSRMGAGDLVLMDAGAEVDFLAADITRTVPVSGRFTEPGRTVYSWVLRAQEAAIATVRPGATYREVHEAGLRVLCEGLREMGVVKGETREIMESGAYQPFFMHRIGHWLGADVHDVGPYFRGGESIRLEPGMVLTVEPGLYFSDANPAAPEWARGIGVRIEDDVLVTRDGRRVLTARLPKAVEDVERFMAAGSWWEGVRPASIGRVRRTTSR